MMSKISKLAEDTSQPSENYRLTLQISGANFRLGTFARIFHRTNFTRKNWILLAATEAIEGNPNPQFKSEVLLNYVFSEQQELRVEIMGTDYEFFGYVESRVANLLNAPNQALALPLRRGTSETKTDSFVFIKCDNFLENSDEIRLTFGANFLKSFVFKPKTYISLWKLDDDEQKYVSLRQSVPFEGSVPIWEAVQVRIKEVYKKEAVVPLRVLVHSVPKIGQETIMGHAQLTYQEIMRDDIKTYPIVKSSGNEGKNHDAKQIGTLFLQQREIVRHNQFVDYVFEGLDILSALAVDFSQVDFSDPSGQGGRGDGYTRLVEQSFSCMVDVLAPYNLSKTVSCFGFGAKDLTDEKSKTGAECFLLKGNFEHNNFTGSEELKQAYRETLLKQHYKTEPGQTITSVIKAIINIFRKDLFMLSNLRYYTITLIIEEVNGDIQELVNYVVPLSHSMAITIFIVGVGNASFKALECFNIYSKREFLKDSKGDILNISTINFVKFETLENNGAVLAKELLKVIPSRVVGYMKRGKERPIMKATNSNSKKT